MAAKSKTPRICKQGHRYYKSSDCPTCPQCEKIKSATVAGFLSHLSAPARRALENAGIDSAKKLAGFTIKEILQLHGIGPASIPILQAELQTNGLEFKQ